MAQLTHARNGQAELAWMADYLPGWNARPKIFTHPSTNRAQRTGYAQRFCHGTPNRYTDAVRE